jgi:heme exporter protein CcmD
MDLSAAHAGFVTASYLLSTICIAGLVIYVFRRDAQARKTLAQIENSHRE